jgi:hypothetical protein
MKQEKFFAIQSLSLENSFGTIKVENDVKLEVTVCIKDGTYGWFEISDVDSGGEEWHAEGGLWFDNKTLTDYDGVFELPVVVTDKLKEWGYITEEVEEE